MFQVFSFKFMFHHFILALHCSFYFFIFFVGRKLSAANLEAKVHWLWHEHRSAPGARKRKLWSIEIHRVPSNFQCAKEAAVYADIEAAFKSLGCIGWPETSPRSKCIANLVNCLANVLSPQGTCGRSFVWNPAFPCLCWYCAGVGVCWKICAISEVSHGHKSCHMADRLALPHRYTWQDHTLSVAWPAT